jgi:SAM-dependent methyltransferase
MTESQPTAFPANAAQAEYWNGPVADCWAARQVDVDTLFGPLTDQLMVRAAPAIGERVVDIGCGGGATLLPLAEAVGQEGSVLGVDVSAPLLARAEARLRAAGHDQVRVIRADAQTHPFEPAKHDLVLSRFGVMFFADPVAAFINLRRALRPGGRLWFMAWAPLDENPWFKIGLDAAVTFLGPPEPTPTGAPGPLAFADPAYPARILKAAGFAEVAIETVGGHLKGAPTAEAEAQLTIGFGLAARLIRTRQPDDATLARILAGITEGLRPLETAAGVRIPATIHYASAIQPG